MRTLPYDCCRCRPNEPTDKCKECLRWADLPQQTWGPRTAVMFGCVPSGAGCNFVPKCEEEKT